MTLTIEVPNGNYLAISISASQLSAFWRINHLAGRTEAEMLIADS